MGKDLLRIFYSYGYPFRSEVTEKLARYLDSALLVRNQIKKFANFWDPFLFVVGSSLKWQIDLIVEIILY